MTGSCAAISTTIGTRPTYLWFSTLNPQGCFVPSTLWSIGGPPIRSHYYTSTTGDTDFVDGVRAKLRNLGFYPEVFSKPKGARSKGVDITLTKDMLSDAFMNNYDDAVLLAGDADYIP